MKLTTHNSPRGVQDAGHARRHRRRLDIARRSGRILVHADTVEGQGV